MIAFFACQNNSKKQTTVISSAEQRYLDASNKVIEMDYDSAIILLRQAFLEGSENPMRIIRDSNFYDLIDDPRYRPEIRLLLKRFSMQNHCEMVRSEEQGEPIYIKGKVLGEAGNQPLRDVSVELVQADINGRYFEEKSMWNPRLFAYLKTNENGAFSINTIQPGRYKDDDGNDVPSHIHITLEAEGYRTYASEFTFENDSIFKVIGNVDNIAVAKFLKTDDKEQYQVILYLQRE